MHPQSFSAQAVCMTAAMMNVPAAEVKSRSRKRCFVRPRQVAMYLAYKAKGLSHPTIGRQFGRDHTTCIAAVKRVETLMARDAKFAAMVAALMTEASAIARSQSNSFRDRRIFEANQLPPRIATDTVCDLAGYCAGTLSLRIKGGIMPKPIDKAKQNIFDRDAVLRALGLMDGAAKQPEASW